MRERCEVRRAACEVRGPLRRGVVILRSRVPAEGGQMTKDLLLLDGQQILRFAQDDSTSHLAPLFSITGRRLRLAGADTLCAAMQDEGGGVVEERVHHGHDEERE
jgi:hypothetical protein